MPEHRKLKTEHRKPSLRICVPVTATNVNRARGHYLRAARKGLWTEMRLDYLEQPDLKRLFRTLPGPVIATCRHAAEGGKWLGTEADRYRLLEEARNLGATFIDVELRSDPRWLQEMAAPPGDGRIIISWHDFAGTPDTTRLLAILEQMLQVEAQVLKIVTWAHLPEDNLRVLSLIAAARAHGREIIAFCMGPQGKVSRIAAPLLGSYLTFAPFTTRGASAPGQLTVNEMKRLWRTFK